MNQVAVAMFHRTGMVIEKIRDDARPLFAMLLSFEFPRVDVSVSRPYSAFVAPGIFKRFEISLVRVISF